MAARIWRTRGAWRLGAVLFTIFMEVVNGYDEIYTISQLSPKSANYEHPQELLQTSKPESAFSIAPSVHYVDSEDELESTVNNITPEVEDHVIVARSADPVERQSRAINIDDVPSTNNEIENNDVEIQNKRKYYDIHPTKTIDYLHDRENRILTSHGFGDKLSFSFPGEAVGAPRARALPLPGPRIQPTAVQPIFATATPRYDPGTPKSTDIHNILTGLVKLLNGNVNIQANTQLLGRPNRPMASRINNRGPPRISDVPPLPPDFDKPITPPSHPFLPTKTPPPYPFDMPPHHGVNLPEQIVPPLNPNHYRPGFHRPIPPWQRPRPRPNPNRRPNPNLPMYKPMPPIPHDIPTLDLPEEIYTKPVEIDDDDQLNFANENESTHSENNIHTADLDKEPAVTTPEVLANITIDDNTDDKKPEEEEEKETTPSTTSSTTSTTSTTTTSTTTTTTTTTTTPLTTTEKEKTTTTTTTTTEKPKTEKPTKQDKEKKKESSYSEKEKLTKDKYKLAENEKPLNKNLTVVKNESVTDVIESSITESPVSIPQSVTPTPTEGLVSYAPNIEDIFNSSLILKPSSVAEVNTSSTMQDIRPQHPYKPRPGIVLDDTEFKPHGSQTRYHYRPEAPVVTAAVDHRRPDVYGEIFDVTVSAVQGPGEKGAAAVHIEAVNPVSGHDHDDIIVTASGEHGYVSIDGKRTYLNLFGETATTQKLAVHTQRIRPTQVQPPQNTAVQAHTGVTGVAIPADDVPQRPVTRPQPRPQQVYKRPQPTVRIDTCIVGDDSTCDQTQNEKCRTEGGISSCQCRPGYARRIHRDPCRRVTAFLLSMRVDRLYDTKMTWDPKLADKESEIYQKVSYEALRAVDSAFSMTPFSDEFVSGSVNSVFRDSDGGRGVFVNYTVLMQENAETLRSAIATDIQKHLLGVIRRRSNNIGTSALWVDTPAGSVAQLQDLDECASSDLNDCHQLGICTNTWGGFRCVCPDTTRDPYAGQLHRGGRECISCSSSHCNDRGTCKYNNNQPYCSCNSGYYGSTCEVDGEVVGVAVGASLAALLVIALTLACLLSWSRKWSREQKAAGMGSPVFSYMANTIKTPPVGQPPYQVSIEERMRWAQIAEAMAQANHYAAESTQQMATRPSSAMFGGYPTLPPVPMPRLGLHMGSALHHNGTMTTMASRANTTASQANIYGYTNHAASDSTSSEASSHVQDRTDLLVPRPKSRARSMQNQTGIYYDVEYENAPDGIYGSKGIPLSTYTISRGPPFYRA